MGIVQRCEAMPRTSVVRRCARWMCINEAVAVVEKIPAVGTVGFNSTATFMQQRMVSATQQHKIRQRRFATVGPVLDVMTVDVTAVRATGKPARPVA